MDKTNMSLKRPRNRVGYFNTKKFTSPKHQAETRRQKQYRRNDLSWLHQIFKAFASVRRWFGGMFSFGRKSGPKPEKRYPLWFRNRVARRRRREKIAKESRRMNR